MAKKIKDPEPSEVPPPARQPEVKPGTEDPQVTRPDELPAVGPDESPAPRPTEIPPPGKDAL